MREPATLGSTYRLQLAGVGFAGATKLVDYFSDLGIQTLYLSPILEAVPGSMHGYDVVNPTRLDPTLGSAQEFEALLAKLAVHDMRALIDIVPNHMACHRANPWWWDTLRLGQGSTVANSFDIDWSRHVGRVLVASLDAPLEELVDGATFTGTGLKRTIQIGGQDFPLAPGTKTRSERRAVLARQHYRPTYWRLSNREGNYRRFFDLDGLIGVRVEDPDVFTRTHRFLETIGDDDRIAGWRVDHVDGLSDPREYLERLAALRSSHRRSRRIVVVEKIMSATEQPPRNWPIDGTTGYEFATRATGLFVDNGGAQRIAQLGIELAGHYESFGDLGNEAKREVLRGSFDAALERLVRLTVLSLNESHPGHDLSWFDIRVALGEITASLGVYRTYFSNLPPDSYDAEQLREAIARAQATLGGESRRAVSLIGEVLTDPVGAGLELVQRWQQLTPAVMAKGVEDTATYRYRGPLVQADVGSDPDHPGCEPDAFHAFAAARCETPDTLNATSTHDSKRSEDARARLATLSELPERWSALVRTWHQRYPGVAALAPEDEVRIFQSFVCLWPEGGGPLARSTIRRIQDYCVKGARESKRHTSWTDPAPAYERRLQSAIAHVASERPFAEDMTKLIKDIAPGAVTNSLAAVVLKCLAPGTPDFYQGAETLDYSLTDPDNRRSVDFASLRSTLAAMAGRDIGKIDTSDVRSMLELGSNGSLKMHLTRVLLHFRRDHHDLFNVGAYVDVTAVGTYAEHVVALARRVDGDWVIGCVARQAMALAGLGHYALAGAWETTALRLPPGAPRQYVDLVSGLSVGARRGRIEVSQCLAVAPVSVLVGVAD